MPNFVYYLIFFFSRFTLMTLLQGFPKLYPPSAYVNPQEVKQSQKDRESMWPIGLIIDTLLLGTFISYGFATLFEGPFFLCFIVMIGLHLFVVEPIYYFYHRLLHTNWLYVHHHSYHHRSIRTEATTSMSFTLLERMSYTLLFSLPAGGVLLLGLVNYWAILAFYLLFDFLNSLGHLNLKMESKWYKHSLLRWLIYSPEYHEKHHSEFTTNYALFVPFFDKMFGTLSKKTFEE